MAKLLSQENKLQEELKIQISELKAEDLEFYKLENYIQSIFGIEVDFDIRKDWTLSITMKDKGNEDGVVLSHTLKMQDKNIDDAQLNLFYPNAAEAVMQTLADETNTDIKISSTSGSRTFKGRDKKRNMEVVNG